MNEVLISTKGQIVIPQEFRKRYRLNPNTHATWIDAGDVLILVPKLADPLLESRGLLKKSGLTQAVLKKERQHEKS